MFFLPTKDLDENAFFRMPGNLERELDPVMMIGLNEHYGLGDDR